MSSRMFISLFIFTVWMCRSEKDRFENEVILVIFCNHWRFKFQKFLQGALVLALVLQIAASFEKFNTWFFIFFLDGCSFRGFLFNCDAHAIWYHLYNFKKVKNTNGGKLLLVRLQAKSNTPPWVFFKFLKFYKRYQITQRITIFDWCWLKWSSNCMYIQKVRCGTTSLKLNSI